MWRKGTMSSQVVKKLFKSLDDLEQSISRAKKVLASQDPIPLEIMRRVASYDDILCKQRKLAKRLCNYIVAGDWEEVTRHMRLINGLSAMVQEEARFLVRGMVVVEGDLGLEALQG